MMLESFMRRLSKTNNYVRECKVVCQPSKIATGEMSEQNGRVAHSCGPAKLLPHLLLQRMDFPHEHVILDDLDAL